MLPRVLLCSLVVTGTAAAQSHGAFNWSGEDPIALRADAGRKKSTGIALMVFGSLNLTLALGMGIGGTISCERAAASADGVGCELFGAVVIGVASGAGAASAILLGTGIPLYAAGVRRGARADRIEAAVRRSLPEGYPAPWERREDPLVVESRIQQHRRAGLGLLTGGGVTFGLGLLGTGGMVGCLFAYGSCPSGLYFTAVEQGGDRSASGDGVHRCHRRQLLTC